MTRGVLVTGAGHGLGAAIARAAADAGWSVGVLDRDRDAAARTAADIGDRAVALVADTTVEAEVDRALDQFAEATGQSAPHGLVANAGIVRFGPLAAITIDDWRAVVDVNLTGTFLCLQAEIPAILDVGRGAIVNVASAAGLMGFANLPAYVASKHGVVGLTKAVALEYARQGVRVNAVCPGNVHTPMLEGFVGGDQDALQGMGKVTPIGRLGTPAEIAEAIVWLCSDAASFVTGHAMAVDGGVLAT